MHSSKVPRAFFLTLLLMSLPLGALMWSMDQHALHLLANAWHTPWLDSIMPYATHLADGITVAVVCLLVLFRCDLRSFMTIAVASVASSLVAQFLKRVIFAGHLRPVEHLDAMPGLQLIEGLALNHHHSFPSGHSTAAFAMCFSLAVIIGGGRNGVLFALLAGLLAYTRVYISQHFMEDVLAGAWLGSIVAWAAYRWTHVWSFSRKTWLHRRLAQRPNQ